MGYVIYAMCSMGMFFATYNGYWRKDINEVEKVGASLLIAITWPVFLVWLVVEYVGK